MFSIQQGDTEHEKQRKKTAMTETHTPLESSPTIAPPDYGKYQHHLDKFDLTEAQKQELLLTIWNIVTAFAEIGFGMDATTLALKSICGEAFENASNQAPDRLYLNHQKD